MSDILNMAPDGLMRLRRLSKTRAVVEIRSPFFPGSWRWAVYRSLPLGEAQQLFHNQLPHHQDDPSKYDRPVVEPGV